MLKLGTKAIDDLDVILKKGATAEQIVKLRFDVPGMSLTKLKQLLERIEMTPGILADLFFKRPGMSIPLLERLLNIPKMSPSLLLRLLEKEGMSIESLQALLAKCKDPELLAQLLDKVPSIADLQALLSVKGTSPEILLNLLSKEGISVEALTALLGLQGMTPQSLLDLIDKGILKEEIFSRLANALRFKMLGTNLEQGGKFSIIEALGATRIEAVTGRRLSPSTIDGVDFIDAGGLGKIQLKGPFLTNGLKPLSLEQQQAAIQSIVRKIKTNTAPDTFVIDTLGLSDQAFSQLDQTVQQLPQASKIKFIR